MAFDDIETMAAFLWNHVLQYLQELACPDSDSGRPFLRFERTGAIELSRGFNKTSW
jgi:hypothetical protein